MILGRTESVGVAVEVDEPPGTEDRPLRLSANVGSFGEVTRVAPGKYRAVYVPPATRFPQVVLVAVWRETGPDAPIEFLRFPLFGVTRLPVASSPGAELRVDVGAEVVGPVTADARGKVEVTLVVPPGVANAVVVAKDRAGLTTTRTLKVTVPPYNRLTAALVPHAVVADGRSSARIEVFYDLGGADVPPDRIRVKPTLGAVAFQAAERGRYVYRYVPPAGAAAPEVGFAVSVHGDPTASAAVQLRLGLPSVARLVLRPPTAPLPANGRSLAPVQVVVLDESGLGLPDAAPTVTANGQPLAATGYKGNGVYEVAFIAPAEYPPGGLVQFAAEVADAAGRKVAVVMNYQLRAVGRPRAVDARVAPTPVPADGRTQARVVLSVRDAGGQPLSGARLFLTADRGTVGPPADHGGGVYEATYVAPLDPPDADPVVRVVDAAGGFASSFPVQLRLNPGRFLLGLRAGVSHSLGDLVAPRVGLDAWLPLRLGPAAACVGLSASYAPPVSVVVADEAGEFSTRVEATLMPVALRLAYEFFASRRASAYAGVGALAAFAHVRFDNPLLDSASAQRWGFGGLAFLAAGLTMGPGQAFVEISYAVAPVSGRSFNLDAGGVALDVGYRFGVVR